MKCRLIVIVVLLFAPAAFAHCDWINGPVVAAARAALAKGDVTPVLRWVPAGSEAEIRSAFVRTLAARAGGGAAREVADQWFFETLVRVHRASEGEPFTGVKGSEYTPEAGIELADHAIDSGSLEEVEAAVRAEMRKRFAAAMEAKKHADESVGEGRHFVHAYAEFIHYVAGALGAAVEH